MLFADGTSAKADALIACDGIHSIIRTQMYRDEGDADLVKISQPLWSGRVVYRILIEAEKLKKVNPSHRVLTKPQKVSSPSHIPDKKPYPRNPEIVMWKKQGKFRNEQLVRQKHTSFSISQSQPSFSKPVPKRRKLILTFKNMTI